MCPALLPISTPARKPAPLTGALEVSTGRRVFDCNPLDMFSVYAPENLSKFFQSRFTSHHLPLDLKGSMPLALRLHVAGENSFFAPKNKKFREHRPGQILVKIKNWPCFHPFIGLKPLRAFQTITPLSRQVSEVLTLIGSNVGNI